VLEQMLAGLETAPTSASAIEAAGLAIEHLCESFTERDYSRRRQAIINANPLLQERELIKFSWYAAQLGSALRNRGIAEPAARLAAELGMAAFRIGWERWLNASDERSMRATFRESFERMKAVAAGVS
jgi:hypothetical protein